MYFMPEPSKKENLLMLSQNHDRGLTSERYFNTLKYVTGKLKDNSAVIIHAFFISNAFFQLSLSVT